MTARKVLAADEQAANILAADARRIQALTEGGLVCWFAVVVSIGCLFWLHSGFDRQSRPSVELLDSKLTVLAVVVVLASLAGGTTGFALLLSRRATLRQIQASLAAIAGQLAELQQARGTMPPTAGG